MKHLRKNIKRIALFLCALFVLLMGFGAYNIIVNGNRWFSSSVNTFARKQKKNVIAGDVVDRSGVILAATVEGKREYAADAATRKAVRERLAIMIPRRIINRNTSSTITPKISPNSLRMVIKIKSL